MQYQNLPAELRQLPQWVSSGPSKVPLNPRTGEAASVTDPKTWATFEEAIHSGYKYIGFVLAPWDPYSIIDLDNKVESPVTEEQWKRHEKILESFNSYTERSASGRGYHIIVKGKIPSGVHRDNVEAYSSGRYMICTGDVVRQVPISDYQELLLTLYGEMKPPETVRLEETGDTIDDKDLVEMAMGAANATKFNDLCNGRWETMGYPSQSEADLALLSILAFYSQSNEQCRRLFRMSRLGEREKAIRNDTYIDYALEKIRAKQPPPIDFDEIKAKLTAIVPKPEAGGSPVPTPLEPLRLKNIELPPGLIGEMAQYFYQTAVRPVPDIALAAAIGLTAGVVGRSYNISGTGLNQYIILVAKTGSGKEGAVAGIDNLVAATRPTIPMIDQFIGPGAFASGQALIKVIDERPCFVSILGEFGLTLQQLCDPNAMASQVMLRKVLLDLYSKSGWSGILRSSVYSDVEKNTKTVQAPNVTILGETTPETFYEGLDAGHISEGLIPRFSIIQYQGNRPPRNRVAGTPPPKGLIDRFVEIVTIALTTRQNQTCMAVQTAPEAQVLLDTFDKDCDGEINGSHNEAEIQIWNRAHLKALKLGALLAVGCNPHQPIVTEGHARWAIEFVQRDVEAMASRFRSGDVGRGDSKLGADLQRVIEIYLKSDFDAVKNYGVVPQMFTDRVVPYCYLIRKTASLAAFRRDRRGSTGALKSAIQDLADANMIVEIPPVQLLSRFNARGRAWAVGTWTVK